MEKLKFGETAILENGKEYVCFYTLEENEVSYVYLVTNSKPLEVIFAKQTLIDGELQLEVVTNKELKQYLFKALPKIDD